ncbi:MAG: hypothetical protein CMN72_15480 [Sphingomonas sp.]|nr:hypothetical protein [Sphingomonas sp.]
MGVRCGLFIIATAGLAIAIEGTFDRVAEYETGDSMTCAIAPAANDSDSSVPKIRAINPRMRRACIMLQLA